MPPKTKSKPPKEPTDQEAINAYLAVEVLNLVATGGDKEPSSAPMDMPDILWDEHKEDVARTKSGGYPKTAETTGTLLDPLTEWFTTPWKTALFGGDAGVFGGESKRGTHVPGLLTFPQETGEAIPAPSFGKTVEGDNLYDWLSRQGFPLLSRDEPSRKIVTDPIIAGSVAKGMAGALFRETSEAALGQYARNALRWAAKEALPAGKTVNPATKLFGQWKKAREASKVTKWTKYYDKFEDAMWKGSDKAFGPEVQDFLKHNFQTTRVKFGSGLADAMLDIRSVQALAKVKMMPVIKRVQAITSDADQLALSRYLRPRVVGGEKVWPTHLSKKFTDDVYKGGYEVFDPDLKKYFDRHVATVERKSAQAVELNTMSKNVLEEYGGDWYPRRFQSKDFINEGHTVSKKAIGPAKELHFARDGYGVRVKMSKEEADTLLKGVGESEVQGELLFHGSPSGKLTSFEPTHHTQVWGQGIGTYVTSSEDVARLYAKGRTAQGARLASAAEKGDVTAFRVKGGVKPKIFDLEAPADVEFWKKASETGGVPFDDVISATNKETRKKFIQAHRKAHGFEDPDEAKYAFESILDDAGIDATRHVELESATGKSHEVLIIKNKRAYEIVGDKDIPSTGSAVSKTDLVKGRAELDPIYSGEKSNVSFVKFSPKQYGGSEEAAAAARDEFTKRAVNAGYKPIKSGESIFVNPFTEAELAEMGELTQAAPNMFAAMESLDMRIAQGRVFREVAKDSEYALAVAEAQAQGKVAGGVAGKANLGWRHIPDSTKWGDLAGMYVRPDIYRELVTIDQTLLGPGKRIYQDVVRNVKSSYTIWSYPTLVRNWFSNAMTVATGGNTPPWIGGLHNTPHYWEALWTKKGSPMHLEFIKKGVDRAGFVETELDMFKAVVKSKVPMSEKTIAGDVKNFLSHLPFMKKSVLTKSNLAKAQGRVYGAADVWHRRAMYLKARKVWKFTPEETIAHVNKYTQNYPEIGNIPKMTRDMPMGAMLVSYPVESIRMLRNGIREHPLRTALVMGAPFLWNQGHKYASGMSDEEYAGLKNDSPLSVTYPFRNERGNWEHIGTEYWHPYGWMMPPFTGDKYTRQEEMESGSTGWAGKVFRAAKVIRSFAFNEPVFNIAGGAISGHDLFTGRPIQQEGEKILPAYTEWFMQAMLPSQFPPYGRNYQRQTDYTKGLKRYGGKEITLGDTAMKTVLGVGFDEYDPDLERERWRSQENWAKREMEKQINRMRKLYDDERILEGEYKERASTIAEKYAVFIREGKERKLLSMIVLTQRDMEAGKKARYDIGELKLLLEEVRAGKNAPSVQRKIDAGK